jgi:chromosome condensin MukBEF ATPase and DNA-binding subunit MukB
VDWPYDVVGEWNDEPVVDWNGEFIADWVDKAVDDCFDDLVMIEHDAESYDWTFFSKDRAPDDCISVSSSRFSSMEVLPLPLRDSFMEETSAYEGPVRELAEIELAMRRVSKAAWDSESDFCIPAFF